MPSFLLDLLCFCLNLAQNMYIVFTSDNPMQKFKPSRYNFRTSTMHFSQWRMQNCEYAQKPPAYFDALLYFWVEKG